MLHEGRILCACEDIGRHNALDKAVGSVLLAGVPLSECMLYTSGRVPMDMVRKAIRAGVPALVSKTMPTVQSLGAGRRIRPAIRVWPETPLNFEGTYKIKVTKKRKLTVRVDLLPAQMIIY